VHDTIPEGIRAKALRMGLSVEVKQRSLAAAPPLYRFSNHGRAVSRWLPITLAHIWLDIRASKGDRT